MEKGRASSSFGEVNEGETDPLAARLAAKARGAVAVDRRHGVGVGTSPDSETERGSRPPRVWLSAALPAPIPGRSAARGGRSACAVRRSVLLRRAGRVDGCWWTYAGGWMQWTVGSFVSAATFAPLSRSVVLPGAASLASSRVGGPTDHGDSSKCLFTTRGHGRILGRAGAL
jgi:hypothetical protein